MTKSVLAMAVLFAVVVLVLAWAFGFTGGPR